MERLFDLDAQLLSDVFVLAISVLILFIFLSYMLFNPIRNLLEARKNKIQDEQAFAAKEKEDAVSLKKEYDAKLTDVSKEAELILNDARTLALKNENKIIDEAKLEAKRIIGNANKEAELEKKRVSNELKQEVIAIATLMAVKVVANAIDIDIQDSLIEEVIKEMGHDTWINS